jgi:dihydrofolate reductase
MKKRRKVILYIAMSLDGYIAKPNDDLSFLSLVEKEGEDYGYAKFIGEVDTVLMGRKTYDWIIGQTAFPHSDKPTYIITTKPRPTKGNTQFYTGQIKDLVSQLKSEKGGTIFCDGGAQLVYELQKEDLIDEYIISIIPILLGAGTRLFKDGRPEQHLEHLSTQSFETGLVQLHYKRTY